MADIPLKSFTFPGLPDKYTTPVVDNTLAVAGAAADAKKTGDEIGAIKNDLNQFPNGTYPNMSVGNADQLISTVGIEDNAPYLFRTSGGSNDIGDREDVKKIVGGTMVNNQLVQNGDFSDGTSGWNMYQASSGSIAVNDGILTCTVSDSLSIGYIYGFRRTLPTKAVPTHVYLYTATARFSFSGVKAAYEFGGSEPSGVVWKELTANTWTTVEYVGIAQANSTDAGLMVKPKGTGTLNVGDTMEYKNVALIDLTQMFGTSIADYVYNLETATAGAGVAWLKKHFPAQFDAGYQAYDAGSMQSVSGLTEHKMVGFNQLDADSAFEGATGITKNGDSFTGTANTFTNFTNIAGWDKIKYISGLTYYGRAHITVPNSDLNWAAVEWVYTDGTRTIGNQILTNSSGVSYALSNPNKTISHLRITYGSNGGNPITVKDISINLHWDGEKDGTYEPYKTWSYALDDSVTLRGIPKVDANGNLYYDGDEYLPDGTVNRRYGIVDLGTLSWTAGSGYMHANMYTNLSDYDRNAPTNVICEKYVEQSWSSIDSGTVSDKTIHVLQATGLVSMRVYDTAYTDSSAFKTAMSGVKMIYREATPTTETALPYQETQIVDDFGTEEFVLADGAFPVPVGHDTMYQNNLRAKLEMSPESPDGDGLYVVQQESGENTYVPLASTATIQDILTRLTALENA